MVWEQADAADIIQTVKNSPLVQHTTIIRTLQSKYTCSQDGQAWLLVSSLSWVS